MGKRTAPLAYQLGLFGPEFERASRLLPVVGEQKDIRYYSTPSRSVLNCKTVTGMNYWSINPYIGCAFGCAYCYARYAHRYVMERAAGDDKMNEQLTAGFQNMPPWLAFERHIFVKSKAPEIVARSLRYGSDKHLELIKGEAIVIGTATDPYQPAERHFRITRGILEAIADHPGLRIIIITKSPLITRDIDVLKRIMRHSELDIHLSLITLRRDLARTIEPRSPTPESRVRALARLRSAGIPAGINCMPVLPGITDSPEDLEELVKRVSEAGAMFVGACALRLQHEARKRYLPFIDEKFPHLSSRYRNTYAHTHNAGEKYRKGLAEYFGQVCAKYGVESWGRRAGEDDEFDAEEAKQRYRDLPAGAGQQQLF